MQGTYKTINQPILSAALASVMTATAAVAQTGREQTNEDIEEAAKISGQTVEVFSGIMDDADEAIPSNLLDKAEAVAIFPGRREGGFHHRRL